MDLTRITIPFTMEPVAILHGMLAIQSINKMGGVFCCNNPFAKVGTSRSPGDEEVLETTVAAIKG
jgi:hypothetical protein